MITVAFLIASCGKPGVDLTNALYEPKIVVEAYLYPGETVSHIKLTRNVPIGSQADSMSLSLTPTENGVTVSINGASLSFDPQTKTYYSDQIAVEYGKSYTLEVSAQIDGKQLHATSTTTTPRQGFKLLDHNLGTFSYGSPSIVANFASSPGDGFYAFSIVSDTATTENFIYANDYAPGLDSANVAKDLNSFQFTYDMLTDLDTSGTKNYSFTVQSYHTWFYSAYIMVIYAGDMNFKDCLTTTPNVQEVDGNFHEPIEIFKGDAIGVFASAITDTVRFSITK